MMVLETNKVGMEGMLMRILLKVLLFPFVVLLTVIVAVCRLVCTFSTALLSIFAFIVFVIAIGTMILLGEFSEGLRIMFLAWLISPYGIPLLATFLVELVALTVV